jgi:four helix bundle protein
MKNYKELDVWINSKKLVKDTYLMTKGFPKEELYGITSQIRRSAVSVPANIAEGHGRNHSKDSIQFFHISRGSLYELETLIILATDLEYLSETNSKQLLSNIETCRKLLNGLIRYFESKT